MRLYNGSLSMNVCVWPQITFARTRVVEWYQETVRESLPGEKRGLLVTMVRWPLVLTSSLPLSPSDLNKTIDTLIARAKANPSTATFAVFVESRVNSIRISIQQVIYTS